MMWLNIPDFQEESYLFGYLGIFIFFVSIDQITFIPEEVTLLSIGYLCSKGMLNPLYAGLFSLAAFMAVDTAYFLLARAGGAWMERLNKRLAHSRLGLLKERFKSKFVPTFLALCFIPRMRFWAPILSGAMRIPYQKFILVDGIGLSLFTTIYILLGLLFHNGLKTLLNELELWQNLIFFGVVIVVGMLIILNVRGKHK